MSLTATASSRKVSARALASTLLALALLVVGTFALAPSTLWASPSAQSKEDLDRLKSLSGKEFETEFLNMMIGHHMSAVDMSKLAPTRANHQELKDAAQKIIADQTGEINSMTGWLQQWYNTTPQSGMMGGMTGMGGMSAADMTKLEGLKGDDFDRAFLMMMREHHMGAVDMAKLVPERATHSELKTLAQNIISSQTSEIEQFDGWLKAWYGADAMGAGGMSGGMSGGGMSDLPRSGSGDSAWLSLLFTAIALAAAMLVGGYWLRKRA